MLAGGRKAAAAIVTYCEERWFLRGLWSGLFVSVLLALLIAWIETAGSATTQRVAETFLINLVAVIGIQVFMGNSGVVSFGHVSFVAMGAYISGLLTTPSTIKELPTGIPHAPSFILHAQLGFLPAGLITIAIVTVFAAVIGIPLVRLSGGAAAIATLSLLVIVETVIDNWSAVTRGPQTYFGIPGYTTVGWALGFAVVAIVVARLFRESGIGLRLRATRTDELASTAVGVDITRARWAAWTLSAAIAAGAGVLWANYFLAIAPQDFYFDLTFSLLVMVIIGGPTVSGVVVGAATITVVTEFLRRRENSRVDIGPIHIGQLLGLTTIVLGLLVVLTMIFRPEGLLGRWELDQWLVRGVRRLGRRHARNGGRGSAHSPIPPSAVHCSPGSPASEEQGVAAVVPGRSRAGTARSSVDKNTLNERKETGNDSMQR
jgi:branched-chain amino acid transport system permease protein